MKARRREMGISQEKLAEFADLSPQMINSIEGCRAWVSDKTLAALAEVLGVEVYQLFTPLSEQDAEERDLNLSRRLTRLKQEIKADINADLEARFAPWLRR
ncbi:MAG: helix-turn-helix transcriptional regulator [Treponema sp.]|nr:helix-turn-helix transcriptional regulator [Treponema sp.]